MNKKNEVRTIKIGHLQNKKDDSIYDMVEKQKKEEACLPKLGQDINLLTNSTCFTATPTGIQDLEKIHEMIDAVNKELALQKENNSKLEHGWLDGESFRLKFDAADKFEEECRTKFDQYRTLWTDQQKVNDQHWGKIRRIERYLAGEDYLTQEEPPTIQTTKKNKQKEKNKNG
ncbi:MAG: hypothetical protein P4L31_06415 [Candidatus Babeliales bacterium]|nr:hypothetical protein [Candidatus Babeliales bacterium]